jgi:hypothetical protein
MTSAYATRNPSDLPQVGCVAPYPSPRAAGVAFESRLGLRAVPDTMLLWTELRGSAFDTTVVATFNGAMVDRSDLGVASVRTCSSVGAAAMRLLGNMSVGAIESQSR